jgi:hypothetical protein
MSNNVGRVKAEVCLEVCLVPRSAGMCEWAASKERTPSAWLRSSLRLAPCPTRRAHGAAGSRALSKPQSPTLPQKTREGWGNHCVCYGTHVVSNCKVPPARRESRNR